MIKFKSGDKVKCIKETPYVPKGVEGIVEEFPLVHWDEPKSKQQEELWSYKAGGYADGYWCADEDCLELVETKRSDTESFWIVRTVDWDVVDYFDNLDDAKSFISNEVQYHEINPCNYEIYEVDSEPLKLVMKWEK